MLIVYMLNVECKNTPTKVQNLKQLQRPCLKGSSHSNSYTWHSTAHARKMFVCQVCLSKS